MNTNSNVYTIIYTTIVVVVVAAVLAVAAMAFKPMQTANIKAETLSQMMVAAGLGTMDEFQEIGNDNVLVRYSENISEAFTVNLDGDKVSDLKTDKDNIELVDNFKPQDVAIKNHGEATLPVYRFKSGATVIPIYGAGLWGPVWGYIALDTDFQTILGVYFDHSGETPGLGSKIKDDPEFQAQFIGKSFDLANAANPFDILKGGAPEGNNHAVDAISGSTMTCRGLDTGIDLWIGAYSNYLKAAAASAAEDATATEE
ncbi:MAG TPA: NADH:ubiquinone reductase (Na(+)-transporting) subunit C [Candidatus Cryptobacteroides pullicola]|nr:NADH:ubiquinone reductase (Na(+)-transporting) subunit C [Candidatus Cryptobacteroides pullicola]